VTDYATPLARVIRQALTERKLKEHARAGELAQAASMIEHLRRNLPAVNRTPEEKTWAKTASTVVDCELRRLERETEHYWSAPKC
jgi:hypothetical protein